MAQRWRTMAQRLRKKIFVPVGSSITRQREASHTQSKVAQNADGPDASGDPAEAALLALKGCTLLGTQRMVCARAPARQELGGPCRRRRRRTVTGWRLDGDEAFAL